MTFRKQLFPLAMCAATFFSGCGGPSDGNPDDQGTAVDECALNTDNCSPNATCTDTAAAFTCACRVGFSGNGVVCEKVPCDDASDCDDDVPCTVDSCNASGNCLHAPTNSLCEANAICHPTDGCTAGRICGSPSDCVDDDPCTQDEMCNTASATCVFAPLDNDDDGEVPLVCGGTDCNDASGGIGADRGEICRNLVDDNCNGVVNDDATVDSDFTLRYDENNCGSCGNVCANGATCYQGACVACGTVGTACCDTTCGSATSCIGGTCTSGASCVANGGTATCAAACGARGEACCAGNVCDLGSQCGAGNTCQAPGVITCEDAGTAILYRLNVLQIPTVAQANNENVVGHNVDMMVTTCGVPDYAGNVDNSLIDLNEALPHLSPDDPIDLQAGINTALACSSSSPSCTRLDIIVSVRVGTDCVILELEDGDGENLAGPFTGTLDGSGNFLGRTSSLELSLPFGPDSNPGTLDFPLSGVVISGNRTNTTLSNVVIGGYVAMTPLEASFESFLTWLGDDITIEDVEPILANLYDVQSSGTCSRMSVGFLASGGLLVP